jgi:Cu(I)/Ag(I) efflux system membrane fusion protein
MKTKTTFLILFVAICAAFGGWFAAKLFSHQHENNSAAQTGERKIRFYQCAMHPQVKSDKPGKCPICGMDLVPIYEGQGALSENLITLDSNSISVINVQSEPVKRATLSRTLHVAGVIQDDLTKRKIISAYNEGRIEKLLANFTGAEVEKGQPLATFYSPNLLSAEREYLVLVQNKSTNGNSVFQQEQQRLRNAAAQRLKRLGLADAQIESLGKSTNALVQTEIVSPMSGTVIERFAYEGQYVKEGEKLFEIGDFSTMWFLFDAYESDLPWLKVGEEIEVTAPSVPGKNFKAKINFIDPNINEPTRSAKIRVELANPIVEQDGKKRRELFNQPYAEGALRIVSPDTLVVPRGAVLNPGGAPLVYIDHGDGAYEPRPVKLGIFGDEGWQVLDGLKEGDRIVTSGNLLMDAQSQFNRGSESSEHQNETSSGHESAVEMAKTFSAMSETQNEIANEFLAIASQMADALASDDFKAFNERAAKLHGVLPELSRAFSNDNKREKLIEQIEGAGHLPKADELATARKFFVPFTMATVEFAKSLRNEAAFKSLKIYKCPMANQGVPGAPKNGLWIQTNGPLRNPFFGEAMLTCGSEVKP